MADINATLDLIYSIFYPTAMILYFVGIPFLGASIFRVFLFVVGVDKKKANGIFWLSVIIMVIAWYLITTNYMELPNFEALLQ